MNAKAKFMRMYFSLPREARRELVFNFAVKPMTLAVCNIEIGCNTKLGKKILKKLGYRG